MFSASLKIVLSPRIKQDGFSVAMLRVIIERKTIYINLKCSAPVKEFVKESGEWMCKGPNKRKANDFNLICRDGMSRANEILVQYRLRRLGLSIEIFVKEFNTKNVRDDLLVYMRNKIKERLRNEEITLSTSKHHFGTVKHLENWKKTIGFSELDDKWAENFELFLKKKTTAQKMNSRWGVHRDVKTYLKCAARDKIVFLDPYIHFKPKSEMGRFAPIHRYELLELWYLYSGIEEMQQSSKDSLRAFLFVCFTGLRHSDVRSITMENLDGDFLELVPKKTSRFGTKVRIPLIPEALSLIADEVSEGGGYEKIFRTISEQKQNESIREVGKRLNIKTPLCFQVGRETFATLYMEMDGKLEVLAAFLGHTTTKMSEKYVKIRDSRKKQESERISGFLKALS